MKKLLLLAVLLLSFSSVRAQETIDLNGETMQLKTAVDGQLDLLWNITYRKYRYFIRTSNNSITELVNNNDGNNTTQEAYKQTLENATSGMSASDVDFTLSSLKTYLETYNKTQDPNYTAIPSKRKLQLRLSGFGGITNSPFVDNPENVKTPVFGAELEMLENKELPKHSGFLQIRHVLEDKDKFQYSTTELSLGYRFRVVNTNSYSLFADVKAATYNFSKSTVAIVENDVLTTKEFSDTAFDAPFIFGIGADFRISECSFITVSYNQLFAIFINNQGNFSTDFTVGYKMKL